MVVRSRTGLPALVISLLIVVSGVGPVLAPVGAQEAPGAPSEPDSRWVVGFHVVPRDIHVGDTWNGGSVVKVNRVLHYIAVESDDPAFGATANDEDGVLWVEEEFFTQYVQYVPNDSLYLSQYAPQQVRANLAWDTSLGTNDKNVCIVDTGVRYTHNDLATEWINGYDYVSNDANPWDGHGHGTHVAGIAAATIDNNQGISGIGNTGIKGVRVLNDAGTGWPSDVADGIEWCADNDGHVINLSLGSSSPSTAEENAIDYAWDQGMIVFAASGNDGCNDCVLYPAAFDNSIAVGCTTNGEGHCSFSNNGPELDLSAPGNLILSTCYGSNSQYCTKSGTSMASPAAAGVAGLIWSYAPHISNADLRSLLEDHAEDLGPSGWDGDFGHGEVDAKDAIDNVDPIYPQVAVMTEDLDDGVANGFSLTGLWRVDDACSTPPSSPNYLGFHRASTCDYNDLLQWSGTATFGVDLTGEKQATLNFKHRWETESDSSAVDVMRVQISTTSGATWTTLASWDARDANQLAWGQETIYLNDYVDQNVDLRFQFDAGDATANSFDGWYIDDINVTATDNFPPVAKAGPDQTIGDPDGSGDATLTLDGSGSFDNDATGSITTYEWYNGATLIGTGANPSVTLPVGTNNVKLVVTDDGGATDDDTVTITVTANVAPVASAGPDTSADDPDGDGQATVGLNGAGSDPDGTVVAYEWREGATVLATVEDPILSLAVGSHTLTLEVTDNGGATGTDDVVVTVHPNTPPTANAGSDIITSDPDADGSQTVTLDGSSSGDSDGFIASYEWTEGGVPVATGVAPSVTFTVGTHTLILEVTDNGGDTSSDVMQVTIDPNIAPSANAGADQVVSDADASGDEPVTLDASASSDADGSIVAWEWKEGATVLGTTEAITPTLAFGDHTITLTVTDEGGATATDTVLVSIVDNIPPTAAFTYTCAGALTCDFDASGSSDDGSITLYEWTFGDTGTASGPGATTSHTYLSEGTYTVCLTVTDDAAGTDSICQDVDAIELLFLVDFDDGTAPGMSLTGLWKVTDHCATPPTEPNYLGYHHASSCSFYTGGSNTGNAQFTVDLTGSTEPVLNFHHRWETRNYPNVHKQFVQVKPTGGTTWTTLEYWHGGMGSQTSWTSHTTDLSAYVGQTVDLRFRFESVFSSSFSNARPGWHIDHVQVGEPGSIIVPPEPPIAVAGPDVTIGDSDGSGAETVLLDGSASSDADGTIVSYEWHEGATLLGTGATLSQSFAIGAHTVVLTVTDDQGETDTDTVIITVTANQAPNADAGADITAGDADGNGLESINLDGTGSSDPDGTLDSYQWHDGPTLVATGAGPTIDLAVGTHTLTLTVTDNGGATDADTVVITVNANQAPTAVAGDDQTLRDLDGTNDEPVHLDGGASSDPDGSLSGYQWHVGATLLGTGTPLDTTLGVGTHTVTLTVTDAGGLTDTDSLTVTVLPNEPPVAVAGADQERNDDDRDGTEPITLSSAGSYDPDGGIVSYSWREGGVEIATGANPTVPFTVGTHTVDLVVADAGGAEATDSLVVKITDNRPPVPSFTVVCSVVRCDYDASASSDPDGDTFTLTWSFSDGTSDEGEEVTHFFPHAGYWDACLVADDGGFQVETCKTVHLITTTFIEDFDTGSASDFSLQSLWRIDDACDDPPSPDHYLGFHTNLLCNYQTLNAEEGGATFTVDLTEATVGTFSFTHRWETESTEGNLARDDMRVQVRPVGGSWTNLKQWDSRDPNQPQWETVGISLDPHVGSELQFRFYFNTYNVLYNHFDGWYIDDIHIVSDAPAPNEAPTASFSSSCVAETCTFDASGSSDAPGGMVAAYQWDFGDGNGGDGEVVTHTYTAGGSYDIQLVVQDNGGLTDSATGSVTIEGNTAPSAEFSYSCDELACSFDGTPSSDAEGDITSYAWDFGDGATSSDATPDHTYGAEGTYDVSLTVEDEGGLTDTTIGSITVSLDPPPPPVTEPPTEPPADPDVPDNSNDPVGDIAPVPWMDIESVWFAHDSEALYAGMKLADIPSTDRTTSYTAYRIRFDPDWNMADPTLGGALPAGEVVDQFEVRALLSPVGPNADVDIRYQLWAATHDAAFVNHNRLVAELEGDTSTATDIIWWTIDRDHLQAPLGASTLLEPHAMASPSVGGQFNTYGATGDATGVGRDYGF